MVNHIYNPWADDTLCGGNADCAEAISSWTWPATGWADYKTSRVSCSDCLGCAATLWATPGYVAALPNPEEPDPVNKPHHYRWHPSGVECIDIASGFDYALGNVIKYVWRCDYKGKPIEDLLKAKTYLERAIADRESAGESES